MCGIFGCVVPQSDDAIRAELQNMARLLRHRGPDQQGFHLEPGVGLGMVRLSIVDLVTGSQPMYSPDRRYCIVFNGEIYNHLELRRDAALADYPFATTSDTETLLAAFLLLGADFLERLNGMFAVAIWDSREKRLLLARDRYGVKPLYLQHRDGTLRFSSEVKALLPAMGRPAPDLLALTQYLQLGYVPSPLCAFAGVEKLPAGHWASFREDEFSVHRWFRPEYSGFRPTGEADVLAILDDQLDAAVRRELLSDVPVGLFLSGGLDSSLVGVYAARHCPGINSFALSFEESTHDESQDAAVVAEHLHLNHETLKLTRLELDTVFLDVAKNLDEPFADPTVLPLLAISRFAREKVKVVLTGWGGDEIFMGYPTLVAHRLARFYRLLPPWLGQRLIPALLQQLPVSDSYMSFEFKAKRFLMGMEVSPEAQHLRWMGYFAPEELGRIFQAGVREQLEELPGFTGQVIAGLRATDPLDRILELDSRLFLEGNGLFQADRMSMLASLEARVPLLNPELSRWVNSLPPSVKMPGLQTKQLLRKLAARYLPRTIITKPKKGFGPPTSQWLRSSLARKACETLAPDRLQATGFVEPDFAARLLREHDARLADHGRKIWALLSLQLWLEHVCRIGCQAAAPEPAAEGSCDRAGSAPH